MGELRGRDWKDGGVCQAKSTSAPMTRLRPCAPVQRLEPCLCKARGAGREVWLRHGYTFSLGSPVLQRKWFSSSGNGEEQLEWFFGASLSSLGVF